MKKIYTGISLALLLPVLTFAEGSGNVGSLLDSLGGWVSTLGKIMFAAVVVAFFYGLMLFILSEDKRENGKSIMLWGVVAIFVMASIWGLVYFIQQSTGVQSKNAQDYKDVVPTI